MTLLDTKWALVAHYKALANRAHTAEQREHYDQEFKKAAKEYNKTLMNGRRKRS